jgi:hypothetical protein
MKNIILIAAFTSLAILTFSACEDNEDDQMPELSNLEVGYHDTIYIGGDVHIEFEVTDNEQLNYYTVKIHPEGEHHDDDHEGEEHEGEEHEWEIDITFNEINGLKNYEVHNHEIEIPEDAPAGEYHFDLLVVDMAGNSLALERDLVLTEGEGGHHDDHDHDDHDDDHHDDGN